MTEKSLMILRRLGVQLSRGKYDLLTPLEQADLLLILGVNVEIEKQPSEENYIDAVAMLYRAQEAVKKRMG